MILPSEEFDEIGKAELPLMTNNHCGMSFLAGHLENRHMTDSLLPNLINWCLSLALMAAEMWGCSPHCLCVLSATPGKKKTNIFSQSNDSIYFAKWSSRKNIYEFLLFWGWTELLESTLCLKEITLG